MWLLVVLLLAGPGALATANDQLNAISNEINVLKNSVQDAKEALLVSINKVFNKKLVINNGTSIV